MLAAFDRHLMDARPRSLGGVRRGLLEFLYFGIKEARACVFVVGFFLAILVTPRAGLLGLPRYDVLLLAEKIGTFWGVWRYPNQLGAWSVVHPSKWSGTLVAASVSGNT